MDKFEKAFMLGQYTAEQHSFNKEASAKDVAALLTMLGKGTASGANTLGKALKRAAGGAEVAGHGAKYLGLSADPRVALAGGLGLAGAGLTLGDEIAQLAIKDGLASKAIGGVPAALGATGGLLAGVANPGLMGGSRINRITHELAQSSRTPAGLVAAMGGVVGLPAALIAYGKMKGREESSLF